MQKRPAGVVANVFILLCSLASIANAHDHHVEGGNMNMVEPTVSRPVLTTAVVSSGDTSDMQPYFQYGEHSGLMVAHIALMTLAWVFILPIGVLLSIARSRYRLPTQSAFLVTNGVAVFFATIYNANTPDLYPNNAHHKLGWIITWIVIVQVLVGVVTFFAGKKEAARSEERSHFIPISAEIMAEHHRLHNEDNCRFSDDSGQGTERNTESLRSHSIASTSPEQLNSPAQEHEEYFGEKPKPVLSGIHNLLASKVPGLLSSKVLRIFQLFYDAVDRLILLFGWATFLTGWVTYGGFFMGSAIFSGLAHFIKGSVFFWFGVVSLGRWAGCFAEIGWAWNTTTTKKGSKFSAEFVESFMIFFYGATNIFLEHLAAWGSAWTAQDLEHLSITVMFIGGGLCGMVIESKLIRSLLNATKRPQPLHSHPQHDLDQEQEPEQPPESYRFSMNPLPALVTFLVGIMMSSHHQESMVSTMIHKQWGTLLVGAAFSRVATYVIFYVKPPRSTLPGRPPTELITAFCLLAGGGIFMVSARDTVSAMESNGLDAMFIFTVSMGLVTFLMAWIIVAIAIKGWAVRRENGGARGRERRAGRLVYGVGVDV